VWDLEKSWRISVLLVIAFSVMVLLITRLVWIQLLEGPQYKKIAEANRIRKLYQQAPRGTFYDRNGAVLVGNRPSFAISVIPAEYANAQAATPFLAQVTGMTEGDIAQLVEQGQAFLYTPVRLKRDVDQVAISQIEENKAWLPGVIIEAIPVRYYVYGDMAAHVFGYIGRISEEEYNTASQRGYAMSDMIGKAGLEHVWEKELRGVDGGREVEVNALGEEVASAGEKTAIAGNSLVLTLDANLQKAAEEALKEQISVSRSSGMPAKGGAIVVLDVKTGGVLALASSPSFNPNAFVGGITSREWENLLKNPDKPLGNRAIQNMYPPGSVFKVITASAALETGVTTPEEIFRDNGYYVLSGWTFYGWEPKGLGKLNIVDAIAMSSDPVFYELGRRLGTDRLASYALTFGLGSVSGIGLPGEEAGVVPTEAWKEATYGEPWYPGETIIAAIGQGYYLVTPLQQALTMMAVANGGIIYKPILVDKVINPQGALVTKISPSILRTIYLRPEVWDEVRRGMTGVIRKGTAAIAFQGFTKTVAGKTGSAETGRDTVHSWFAGYAPVENPEIAFAVLVEDAGEGAMAAVPLGRKIVEVYYGLPAAGKAPAARSD